MIVCVSFTGIKSLSNSYCCQRSEERIEALCCVYGNHSCSLCLCSSSHCRWSFHRQSLLPATDHRSFYHPSGSPGSVLRLLDTAGCWIRSSHLPVCVGRTPVFSVRLSGPPFYPGDGLTDPKLFWFDRSTGEKKKKVLPYISGRNSLTYWPRGSKLLSVFSLLSAQIVTSEESNFTFTKQYSDFTRSVQLQLMRRWAELWSFL